MRCLKCPCSIERVWFVALSLSPSPFLTSSLSASLSPPLHLPSPSFLLHRVLLLAFNRFFGGGIEPDILLMLNIYSATKRPSWWFFNWFLAYWCSFIIFSFFKACDSVKTWKCLLALDCYWWGTWVLKPFSQNLYHTIWGVFLCPCPRLAKGFSPKALRRASGSILGYLGPVFRCQSLACNLVGVSSLGSCQLDCWEVLCKVKGELTVLKAGVLFSWSFSFLRRLSLGPCWISLIVHFRKQAFPENGRRLIFPLLDQLLFPPCII